ncbi:uncharacterized protein Z518_01843 [Rhinocladiella mackenziei CBS 650.93]|uniref:Rhinocladiella mackenziei CBS 650.93 unplaced genomic scaffold supercont1.2, whole genome shotgun sequence n=1 Tax=Rhinocladiella mackenziei CBS 650.93 TaxID=1442369 RepID=A0A0D2JDD3_9EURO|nr:uncharacterized protein Z518_01843 [Rhinocladiella mackenziei CBS 650.93]KIX07190.1 hypothetical protein Z518_01843 [Rhinocladiella mackenziei CBS 650.93]
MPLKPLTFKGDKKPKKRKHRSYEDDESKVTTAADGSAEAVDPSQDDSWTVPDLPSDLAGPVILVLPTMPHTCLASDAHGNIFASPLENMVENYAETAEPHDVRQVWVASTVVGTGQLSFKGSHGGYLSCDSIGVLGARREARGVEEGFVVEATENIDGKPRWRICTAATKTAEGDKGKRYISAETETSTSKGDEPKRKVSVSLRGDGEADSDTTQIILKMQARFKPRVQQNKETKAKEKVSRRELEQAVGRRLEDDEVKRLKRAKKEGTFYEEVLDVRVKGKHDKFAS